MASSDTSVEGVLNRVEQTLETARYGLEDLLNASPPRRMAGLRNLIVFGRAVTFALQNLKSVVGDKFDDWYGPHQEELKRDPLMRHFVEMRNEIEKQGKLGVSTYAHIHSFDGDMSKFGKAPPGAVGFEVGGAYGGSGWIMPMPDGSEEIYYASVPPSLGEVKQYFVNLPSEVRNGTVEELSQLYIDRLAELVTAARAHFLGLPPEPSVPERGKPHLRLVK